MAYATFRFYPLYGVWMMSEASAQGGGQDRVIRESLIRDAVLCLRALPIARLVGVVEALRDFQAGRVGDAPTAPVLRLAPLEAARPDSA